MAHGQTHMLGYGTSLSTESPSFTGRVVGGSEAVAEALIRRLSGRCWYDPNYGFPIAEYTNSNMVFGENHVILRYLIANECRKEYAVEEVSVTTSVTGENLQIHINVILTDRRSSFELVLDLADGELNFTDLVTT